MLVFIKYEVLCKYFRKMYGNRKNVCGNAGVVNRKGKESYEEKTVC